MNAWPSPHVLALPDRGYGPIDIAVHEAGAGTPVIFVHGFPELAYSWRSQVSAVSDAGFRAIAPDMRGYGNSSAPPEMEAYDLGALCGDLVDVCDALEIEAAVFVGHDWGGGVTWAMPALHPDRVLGLVGLCTPYMSFPTTDVLRAVFAPENDDDHYMLWFQKPGVAESVLDEHVALLFDRLMRRGAETRPEDFGASATTKMNPFRDLASLATIGEPLGDEASREFFVRTFQRTGFRGGINWYRNMDRNAERYPEIAKGDPGVPCLMLCAELDPVLPPTLAANMPNQIADLEMATIDGSGHWLQQDRPEEVNSTLIRWLNTRFA
ncbi:MAG: alpha/beta hydrolase [Acidimicrobiia bacterium]